MGHPFLDATPDFFHQLPLPWQKIRQPRQRSGLAPWIPAHPASTPADWLRYREIPPGPELFVRLRAFPLLPGAIPPHSQDAAPTPPRGLPRERVLLYFRPSLQREALRREAFHFLRLPEQGDSFLFFGETNQLFWQFRACSGAACSIRFPNRILLLCSQ